MKWFKHDSNANRDSKLQRVMLKYGMEGYGLYWFCLELIAQTVEKHNLTFELEHDAELIAAATQIHYERVQEMMVDFVKWGLFEQNGLLITCLKMATRTDEYTQKLMRNTPNVPTLSGQTPDKVPPNRSIRLNRLNREEGSEKRFSDDDLLFAQSMYKDLLKLNPDHKEPKLEKWADIIRLMRTSDSKSLMDIQQLWTWANQNDFWRLNILSPAKLRKNWDQLSIQKTKPQVTSNSQALRVGEQMKIKAKIGESMEDYKARVRTTRGN